MSERPAPSALWAEAEAEHPGDPEARRARYRELMVEHGHLVERAPGRPDVLPCGWPGSGPRS